MTAPVIRQYADAIPAKGQAQTTFDTNVNDWLDWTTLQFAPDLVAFGTWADQVRAALITGNLPPLTGRQLDAVRVNAAGNGVEFADVTAAGWALLDDANAAAQLVTLGVTATAAQINQLATLPIAGLTKAQAEAAASTVFGTVSGQRLDEMWVARRWQYESAATAFAFSTSYTLAHGLGAQPGDVSLYLECVTTDGGFSVGERIHLDSYQNFDSSRGVSLITTTANIIVRFAAGLYLYGGTGTGTDLTAARWRFVVRASK